MDHRTGISRFARHHSQALFGSQRGDLVGKPAPGLAPGYLRDGHRQRCGVNRSRPVDGSPGLDLGLNDHQQPCALLVTGGCARLNIGGMVS
jgi:hypothetical protein